MQLGSELHLCGGANADADVLSGFPLFGSCMLRMLHAPRRCCMYMSSLLLCFFNLYEGCAVYIACLHAG